MSVALDQLKDTTKGKRRTIIASVILVSIVVHVLIGIGAGIWIVARYLQPPEATFVAKKIVSLPPKILDPKMAAAEFEAAAPKPVLDQKIASLRATDFALPDLPQMPTDTLMEFDPSAVISNQVVGAVGGMGAGGGGGSGGGGDGSGSAINFFGIEATGRSVIIIFDISQSVLNKAMDAGISIDRIKEETIKLIDGLSINTTFNLFQFSRYYQPFAKSMVAPTEDNKEKARNWLERDFQDDGSLGRGDVKGVLSPAAGKDNGITFVLEGALKENPDMIFLISDGSFQSEQHSRQVPWDNVEDLIEDFQDNQGNTSKIHFIGFQVKDSDRRELKRMSRRTDGSFTELDE
jgi:hypothetical protein